MDEGEKSLCNESTGLFKAFLLILVVLAGFIGASLMVCHIYDKHYYEVTENTHYPTAIITRYDLENPDLVRITWLGGYDSVSFIDHLSINNCYYPLPRPGEEIYLESRSPVEIKGYDKAVKIYRLVCRENTGLYMRAYGDIEL